MSELSEPQRAPHPPAAALAPCLGLEVPSQTLQGCGMCCRTDSAGDGSDTELWRCGFEHHKDCTASLPQPSQSTGTRAGRVKGRCCRGRAQCCCTNPSLSPLPSSSPLFFFFLMSRKFFPLRISAQRNGAKHFSFIIIMPVKRTP